MMITNPSSCLSSLLTLSFCWGGFIIGATNAFPRETYPWQEPTENDQRSPCPAMNTLANHGFINRNGRDIYVDDLADAVEMAYSMDREALIAHVVDLFRYGLPYRTDEDGRYILNLDYLRALNHDASFTRLDRYYKDDEINDCLIDNLLDSNPNEDFLTPEHISDFQQSRLLDSLHTNEFNALHVGFVGQLTFQASGMMLLSQDATFQTIDKSILDEWLRYNRLSDQYQTRVERGLDLAFFEPTVNDADSSAFLFEFHHPRILATLESDVTLPSNAVKQESRVEPLCVPQSFFDDLANQQTNENDDKDDEQDSLDASGSMSIFSFPKSMTYLGMSLISILFSLSISW